MQFLTGTNKSGNFMTKENPMFERTKGQSLMGGSSMRNTQTLRERTNTANPPANPLDEGFY